VDGSQPSGRASAAVDQIPLTIPRAADIDPPNAIWEKARLWYANVRQPIIIRVRSLLDGRMRNLLVYRRVRLGAFRRAPQPEGK
jgi:hypothetical protein